MGFETKGFSFGREDTFEADLSTYWGSEATWLGNDVRYAHGQKGLEGHGVMSGSEGIHGGNKTTHTRHLEAPLAAAHHGELPWFSIMLHDAYSI